MGTNSDGVYRIRTRAFLGIFVFILPFLLPGNVLSQDNCPSLYPYKYGHKWGFVNLKGEIVIPAKFDFADEFSNGRALVKERGLWGIMDEKQSWIIRPQIKEPMLNLLDRMILISSDDKPAFLADDGTRVPGTFQEAFPFSDGMAAVRFASGWGYINKKGKIIIKPQFDRADSFVEGLAEVVKGDVNFVIDKSGNRVFDVPQNMWMGNFSEGLADIQVPAKPLHGYIDRKGTIVIKPQFREAGEFSEGLARVLDNYTWGFIDKTGEFSIKAIYDEAGDFHEGLASIRIGEKWGFIDKAGKVVIQLNFDRAYDFQCGIAYVETGHKWGYIDKKGEFIFSPKPLE